MTTAKLLFTTHGLDLHQHASVITAWRGTQVIGYVFPAVVDPPSGKWYGRLRTQAARTFDTEHSALAYVVGGCPDCRCDPVACAQDDTGDSCLDCGFCVNGCSIDCPPAQAAEVNS